MNKDDIREFNIESAVGLNPDNWLSETPLEPLDSEKKQLSREFSDSEHLLMRVKYLVDNILATYSEKECPITRDPFKFVAVEENNGRRYVLLECLTCYRKETLSGEHVKKINGKIFPVSKAEIKELERNNIRILK